MPYDFTDEQLQHEFEEVAPIRRAFLVTKRGSGLSSQRSKGYGFVVFTEKLDAEDAVKVMHRKEIQGRKIHVEIAREQPKKSSSADDDEGKTSIVAVSAADDGAASTEEGNGVLSSGDGAGDGAASLKDGQKVTGKDLPKRRIGKASAVSESVRTVVIEGLADSITEKQLKKRVRKYGSVANVILPSPESSKDCTTG